MFFFGCANYLTLKSLNFPWGFCRTLAFTLSRGDSGVDGGDSGGICAGSKVGFVTCPSFDVISR